MNFNRTSSYPTAAMIVWLVGLVIVGCGSVHSRTASTVTRRSASRARANAVDRAFVREMLPRLRLEVELANIARRRGEHARIRDLARTIVATRTPQIIGLRRIATSLGVNLNLSGAQTSADARALGLSLPPIGTSTNLVSLARAKPFDRAFIDTIVAAEQAAMCIARVEFARGATPDLELIASDTSVAGSNEIPKMNSWRTRWYGTASPSGGLPPG